VLVLATGSCWCAATRATRWAAHCSSALQEAPALIAVLLVKASPAWSISASCSDPSCRSLPARAPCDSWCLSRAAGKNPPASHPEQSQPWLEQVESICNVKNSDWRPARQIKPDKMKSFNTEQAASALSDPFTMQWLLVERGRAFLEIAQEKTRFQVEAPKTSTSGTSTTVSRE